MHVSQWNELSEGLCWGFSAGWLTDGWWCAEHSCMMYELTSLSASAFLLTFLSPTRLKPSSPLAKNELFGLCLWSEHKPWLESSASNSWMPVTQKSSDVYLSFDPRAQCLPSIWHSACLLCGRTKGCKPLLIPLSYCLFFLSRFKQHVWCHVQKHCSCCKSNLRFANFKFLSVTWKK